MTAPDRIHRDLLAMPPNAALAKIADWLDDCDNHQILGRPGGIPTPPFTYERAYVTVRRAARLRSALFMAAPSHQGGHSDVGMAIAEALGVSFPIQPSELVAKARGEDLNPALLWPWLVRMQPDYFTAAERASAQRPFDTAGTTSEAAR